MHPLPSFLPAILSLDGDWHVNVEMLYDVFTRDFKEHKPRHEGKIVFHDNRILPDGRGKEEGFWHIVTREDKRIKERLPDLRRAERLPWARGMLESLKRSEIILFDYDEGSSKKGIRRYIWLKDFDYLIVLRRAGKIFMLISVMFLNLEWKKEDLRRKYDARVR